MGALQPATMDNVQSIRNIERIRGFYNLPWMPYSSSRHNGFIPQKYERSGSNFLLGSSQFPKKHCFLEGYHVFLFFFVPLIPVTSGWRWASRISEVVVTVENRTLRGNSVHVPICLPQTPQVLDRTEASAVRGRRLSFLFVRKYYNNILVSVPASQKTDFDLRKANPLMMFREIIAVVARIIHIKTQVTVVCSTVLKYTYIDERLL